MLKEMLQNAPTVASVEIYFFGGINPIDRRLQKLGDDDRINFIKALVKLRFEKNGQEEIVAVLGEWAGERLYYNRLIMYTLTSDGKQFRCWYDWPGRVKNDGKYVDSCGIGHLFTVTGEEDCVSKYVKALTQGYTTILHQSGVRYFLPLYGYVEVDIYP